MVSEVNAISEELNKYRSFEVVLLSAAARGSTSASKSGSRYRAVIKISSFSNAPILAVNVIATNENFKNLKL